MTCTLCRHENPPEARFCGVCSTPLEEGTEVAEGHQVGPPVRAPGDIAPRELGELISETFSVYRRNFWPFVLIALIPNIPFLVSNLTPWPVVFFLALAGIVLLFIQAGASVCGVVGHYASRRVDVVECYRVAWRRALSLIGAPVLILLGLVIPAILSFFVIGIPLFFYLLVIWLFASEAIMVEGKGPIAALGRSRELVRGTWWRVFGIGVVFGLMLIGLSIARIIPAAIIGFISPVAGTILETAVSVFVAPIVLIGRTLVYLDLRVRKEGYTLAALAQDAGL